MVVFRKPDFPADAFAGTARYYARFRPAYPPPVMDSLLARHAGIPREETLLDLACGPGRVAFALAAQFRAVIGVDLEPEMIAEAQVVAAAHKLENVKLLVGKAEDFDPPLNPIGMITIGDAYHRVDQKRVLENARTWLKHGGSFAIFGSNGLLSGRDAWQQTVIDVVQKWTGRPGGGYIPLDRVARDIAEAEDALRDVGFEAVDSYSVLAPISWTIDSLIGYFSSTSHCSRAALGDKADGFSGDLRRALADVRAEDRFDEQWRFGFTFGRRPFRSH